MPDRILNSKVGVREVTSAESIASRLAQQLRCSMRSIRLQLSSADEPKLNEEGEAAVVDRTSVDSNEERNSSTGSS